MSRSARGSELLAQGLERHGVGTVFGVPGTQNVPLLEAFRAQGLRVLSGTSELTAAFMANGHARVTRRPAVLTTIPGPGFAYALPGVAEARLDAVPLVWVCVASASAPDGRATLQAIPQAEMAGPLVKEVLEVGAPDQVHGALDRAFRRAGEGEPGPVLVHVAPGVLGAAGSAEWVAESGQRIDVPQHDEAPPLRAPEPDPGALAEAVARVQAARRPLLLVGQGGLDDPEGVRALAEGLGAPVVTSTSARGVVPEEHPLVMPADRPAGRPGVLNELLETADLVVALGYGFSHNGSRGFQLRLDPERLLNVNASAGAFRAPYRGRTELEADVRSFLVAAAGATASEARATATDWSAAELAGWRQRLAADGLDPGGEPRVSGVADGTMGAFFQALQGTLPPDTILVTDSGRHQMLARAYWQVRCPGGLMAPSNFQSMGFGVPAALGAKVAAPGREVVALVGDGGLQITLAELLVARRERLGIRVVVFTDGEFALIAEHQRRDYGRATAARLVNPDLEILARALGCEYLRVGQGAAPAEVLAGMTASAGPTLVEVPLGRSGASRARQARAAVREAGKGFLGSRLTGWLRRLRGRGR